MVFTRLWRIIHKLSNVVSLIIFPFCFGESKYLSSYLLAYFVCPPSMCTKASQYNFLLSQSYYAICHFLFSIGDFPLEDSLLRSRCSLSLLHSLAVFWSHWRCLLWPQFASSLCLLLVLCNYYQVGHYDEFLCAVTCFLVYVYHVFFFLCLYCFPPELFKDKIMKSLFQCLISKQF